MFRLLQSEDNIACSTLFFKGIEKNYHLSSFVTACAKKETFREIGRYFD
jgi:hypothetical protein